MSEFLGRDDGSRNPARQLYIGVSHGLMVTAGNGERFVQTATGIAVFVMILGTVAVATPSVSPTEVVKGTIDEVLRLLSDDELKKPNQLAKRRHLIEEVIGYHFDYEEMAKRSLAVYWKKLNEPQRQEFVELFQSFLSQTYANRIEAYTGEQVQYLSERLKGNYAEVQTKIVSAKTELPLDYRLLNKSGDWYVYNIVIEGVSLISNYRSQFQRIIRSSSYADLVQKLRNKSEEIKAP